MSGEFITELNEDIVDIRPVLALNVTISAGAWTAT